MEVDQLFKEKKRYVKYNFSKEQHQTLKNLARWDDILRKPADKGEALLYKTKVSMMLKP